MNTQERIFPAWSLLDQSALERLLGSAPAISVVDDAEAGIAEAPLVALIRLLIARAIARKGLALTAKGNLSRADVGPCSPSSTGPVSTRRRRSRSTRS